MEQTSSHPLTKAAYMLARPVLLFYALPWLMCLLVLGTVAQRYIGLYQSEKIFFGSFVLWLGYVPLPGIYTTLAVIAVSLMANLALKTSFAKPQMGVLLTHVSALVLLLGGLISACAREEGYMVLGDGETGQVISDYYQRELAVIKDGKTVMRIPQTQLHDGAVLSDSAVPFSIHVDAYCYACTLHPREHSSAHLRGLAEKVDIAPAALSKEDADNHAGVAFTLSGASPTVDGTYVTFQTLAQQPGFTLGKDNYTVVIEPSERPLPFALQLKHFDKADYPGTDMARSYQSEVTVKDNTIAWNASIEMNQPLHYRGYTIYQSSYVERDGKFYTVLAVVKNAGRWFPYAAIAMLCAGLLLHLGMMFTRKNAS